jgi:hypothetical protein
MAVLLLLPSLRAVDTRDARTHALQLAQRASPKIPSPPVNRPSSKTHAPSSPVSQLTRGARARPDAEVKKEKPLTLLFS